MVVVAEVDRAPLPEAHQHHEGGRQGDAQLEPAVAVIRVAHSEVGTDARASTLFRVVTDRELPLRTKLDVVVRLSEPPPGSAGPLESLTFQIRRKPHFRLGL